MTQQELNPERATLHDLIRGALTKAGFLIDGSPSAAARVENVADELLDVFDARFRTEREHRAAEQLEIRGEIARTRRELRDEQTHRAAAEEEARRARAEVLAAEERIATHLASEVARLQARMREFEVRQTRYQRRVAKVHAHQKLIIRRAKQGGRALLGVLISGATTTGGWLLTGRIDISRPIGWLIVGSVVTLGVVLATWAFVGRSRAKWLFFRGFSLVQLVAGILTIAGYRKGQ
jgi:hypothetical protein